MTRKRSYGKINRKEYSKNRRKWENNFGKTFGFIIANIKKVIHFF